MLAEADKKNVPMLIDILWNCIQNSKDKTEIVNQLSSLTSITSINSGNNILPKLITLIGALNQSSRGFERTNQRANTTLKVLEH